MAQCVCYCDGVEQYLRDDEEIDLFSDSDFGVLVDNDTRAFEEFTEELLNPDNTSIIGSKL